MSQVETMVQHIQEKTNARCEAIIQQAQQQAQSIIQEAYQQANQQVHHIIVEERALLDQAYNKEKAKLWTLEQQAKNDKEQVFLETAIALFYEKLELYWQESRDHWIEILQKQALKRLPASSWTVYHPKNFTEPEKAAFVKAIHTHRNQQEIISFTLKEAMQAGLIIQTEYITLDASIDGILRDKNFLASRLLTLLQEEKNHE